MFLSVLWVIITESIQNLLIANLFEFNLLEDLIVFYQYVN